MRLDKYLSHSGLGTRTETRKLIKQGVVEVNGEVCLDIGRHINQADVRVFGDLIQYEEFLYYMMNKPKGVVSASKDPKQPTVIDLLQGDNPLPVHVVGRLDKDTTGLLLLTNDGALAHKIISPKSKLPKVYEMTLEQPLSHDHIQTLEQGILLDEKITLPCSITHVNGTQYTITLMEGRFHQVKRMMHHVGNEVLTLHRTQIGPLVLDESLAAGNYRSCRKEEVKKLLSK
jgi:16S rRNA pseudouridine516 synthase